MNVWVTKEGKRLKIKDMSTYHIKNCVNMLEKQIKTIQKDYDDVLDGCEIFGDTDMTWNLGSYICIEAILDKKKKFIAKFKKELKIRGEL